LNEFGKFSDSAPKNSLNSRNSRQKNRLSPIVGGRFLWSQFGLFRLRLLSLGAIGVDKAVHFGRPFCFWQQRHAARRPRPAGRRALRGATLLGDGHRAGALTLGAGCALCCTGFAKTKIDQINETRTV
jgi:hypothetical protein